MAGRVRFVCLLHSHQPVGNFDHVVEEAYQKSYLPYVDVFERFPEIPLTHHISGCLLEWLDNHHPDYLDRMAARCKPDQEGRPWEMIGGGFQEPILSILPERDRLGQIHQMADFIESHFGTRPRGLWLTERVWEPGLVKDMADAGIHYLTLDDNHFRAAGITEEELTSGFLTEDQGRTLVLYPALEKLRYIVPFKPVAEVMDYLRSLIPEEGERVVCYADDGEKFGVWPHTYKSVYEEGWLHNFLAACSAAQEEGWLVCSTLSDAYDQVEVGGPVYLPENSYREMTEWAWPAERLSHFYKLSEEFKNDDRGKEILSFVRGGNWRAFRMKYPEIGKLYAKMMEISEIVDDVPAKAKYGPRAKEHLYRGQCNCPYWHGVFGGLYLPHLRSAVFRELIHAENAALTPSSSSKKPPKPKANLSFCDFDFDGQKEIKLSNAEINVYLHPGRGGHLYEFDVRRIAFNVGDTLSRRYEAYHDKAAEAVVGEVEGDGNIHEMMRAKESGLDKLLSYDDYLRESLVDHLSPRKLTTEDFLNGSPPSNPELRSGKYEYELMADGKKKNPTTVKQKEERRSKSFSAKSTAVRLWKRTGLTVGHDVEIRKRVTVGTEDKFDVDYVVENRGPEPLLGFFAVEMNYALLAGNAPDRYFYHEHSLNAGPLAHIGEFGKVSFVGLKDHWLDVALTLRTSTPAEVSVCPVRTVSNSEGGLEAVYQCSSVILQWSLDLEPWKSFSFELTQEIGRAEN